MYVKEKIALKETTIDLYRGIHKKDSDFSNRKVTVQVVTPKKGGAYKRKQKHRKKHTSD
jgi:hypothetical protein